MKTEPSIIVAIVAAALTAFAAFGLPVSDTQREALLQLLVLVVPTILGAGVVTRQFVWSKASVEKIESGEAGPKLLP